MIFCNFKEPQDALNVEVVDASVMSNAMSLRAHINVCYRLFNLTTKNVLLQRTLSRLKGQAASHPKHSVDAVRFPPKCLAQVKQTLIEATLSTHDIAKEEEEAVKTRLQTNPLGYIIGEKSRLRVFEKLVSYARSNVMKSSSFATRFARRRRAA